MRSRRWGVWGGVLVAVGAAAGDVAAQVPASSNAFVVRVGADTFAVERLVRSGDALEGEIEGRQVGRFRYRAELGEAGRVDRFELDIWGPGAPASAPAAQVVSVEFRGDSAIAEVGRPGGPAQTQRVGTREGALPLLSASFGLVEQILVRARAQGGDTVEVPLFNLMGGQTLPAQVVWMGPDSAEVMVAGVALYLRVGEGSRLEGGRIPAQRLEFERVAGASVPTDASRLDYSAPVGAPYSAEEVRVSTAAGHVLAGTLTLPADVTLPVPAVVTITGSGGQERDESVIPGYRPFRQIADTLSRRGIAVLRLDDRGVGASTGDAASATSADFADDVRAALDYLYGRPEVDSMRLALVGHSEGGLIAPLVAAEGGGVAAIVIMAGPARTGREIIRMQQRYAIERNPALEDEEARDSAFAAAAAQLDSLATRSPWVRWFMDHDPLPTVRRVRQPVLILHGATDRQVTADQAEELAEAMRAAGNDDVTLRVFPEVNHLFLSDAGGDPAGYLSLPSRTIPAEVLGELADWLADRLGAGVDLSTP